MRCLMVDDHRVAAGPADDAPELVAERLRQQLTDDLDAGFAELVAQYQRLVHTTVLRACHHPVDAEDLAAEAFLRAYRALRGYSPEQIAELQFRPWLVTIALNTWRNAVRDRIRRPLQVPMTWAAERPQQPDAFEAATDLLDQRRELAELIGQLPEQQRIAVVLRHVCQLSIGEVAQVLNCPAGTAKSHISRGLAVLKNLASQRQPPAAGFGKTTLPQRKEDLG